MKKVLAIIAVFAAASVYAVDVDNVIVRQQWPWSTDVKVEYRLSNVGSQPVGVSVKVFNGDTELVSPDLEAACSGDLYGMTEGGVYSFTIDPVKAFGNSRIAFSDFKVRLTAVETPGMNDVLYRIVDLTNGEYEDLTRADFYNNKGYGSFVTNYSDLRAGFETDLEDVFIWTGVTNNPEYTTTKLVLRRIPAKGASWPYGDAFSKMTCQLTNDFFIGVFSFTYGQWNTVMGNYDNIQTSYPANEESHPELSDYPVSAIQWQYLAGLNYTWPSNPSDIPEGSGSSVICVKMMSIAPGLVFNLPTEAQWEFAARGGTTNELHGATVATYVAWDKNNQVANRPHPVGRKLPNAFGLYDVLGNVAQYCRDYNATNSLDTETETTVVEPTGPTRSESSAVCNSGWGVKAFRGYGYSQNSSWFRGLYRRSNINDSLNQKSGASGEVGFRVWCRTR